jgi:hypothetical protein
MTEEANASGNALDMPTSVWSDMARKYVEPPQTRKANDDRRQSVDASRNCRLEGAQSKRPHSSIAKPPEESLSAGGGFSDGGDTSVRLEPYEGKLSSTVLRGGRAGNSPLPLDIKIKSKSKIKSRNGGKPRMDTDRQGTEGVPTNRTNSHERGGNFYRRERRKTKV